MLRRLLEPKEYTAADYAKACKRLGVLQSMGRVGCALDNAAAEAFNSTIKVEYIHRQRFRTRAGSPHQDRHLDRRFLQRPQAPQRLRRHVTGRLRTLHRRSPPGPGSLNNPPRFQGIDTLLPHPSEILNHPLQTVLLSHGRQRSR
ncbi:hypothetical protein [Micromonospora sp. RTP1Z1]|uniref:hypothetical protein n=1 Tax=Micromonospora sp. RTP1Z1 TaxID=2994043 RepID=UPI0029C8A1A1|nr:hypothetical protein [Micromonospora sp. RTP1Z1]